MSPPTKGFLSFLSSSTRKRKSLPFPRFVHALFMGKEECVYADETTSCPRVNDALTIVTFPNLHARADNRIQIQMLVVCRCDVMCLSMLYFVSFFWGEKNQSDHFYILEYILGSLRFLKSIFFGLGQTNSGNKVWYIYLGIVKC